MKHKVIVVFIIIVSFSIYGFTTYQKTPQEKPIPINVVDIEKEGFNLLEKIQGRWLGINSVAGFNMRWFVWDYRAISQSHIHGIFEGGSMGNLFTSFFVADFKGTKTIMARNGGVLNGIYRTSYFVLDKVRNDANGDYYRLVDAVGGEATMSMELRFKNDSLYWNSYTSQLGYKALPSRHMTYKGKKYKSELANATSEKFDFPKKEIAYTFPKGFEDSHLYTKKSASFLWQTDSNKEVYEMAKLAKDPITIRDYPYLSQLKIHLNRHEEIKNKRIMIYLSTIPLTDDEGNISGDTKDFDNRILSATLMNGENKFNFTYVHPGDYFVTAIADMDNNFVISKNDRNSKSIQVTVTPEKKIETTIDSIVHKSKVLIRQNLGNDFYVEDKKKEEEKEEEIPVIDWAVTYDGDVKHIIHNNCVTCHGGPSPSARLDLSTIDELKFAVKRKELIKRMNDKSNPMPPKEMLSLRDRLIVFKWVKDGLQ